MTDSSGRALGHHTVNLDPEDPNYEAFADLAGYLYYHVPLSLPGAERISRQRALLSKVGDWTERNVFGELLESLPQDAEGAPTVVSVSTSAGNARRGGHAQLLHRPYEVSRWSARAGARAPVRFVYRVADAVAPRRSAEHHVPSVRILAVFSVPEYTQPLDLRRERHNLQAGIDRLAHDGVPVELHILQYGATRQTLRRALSLAEGWDVIHFSTHGTAGHIVLEDESGAPRQLAAAELRSLLRAAGATTKLVTLSSCLSGASALRVAEEQLQIDQPPEGALATDGEERSTVGGGGLAHDIARELGCAVLAMRFEVDDEFAADLTLGIYRGMLEEHRPLPQALEAALARLRAGPDDSSPLGSITPILVGTNAASLRLDPASRAAPRRPTAARSTHRPPEPTRFVGRLSPMLRASLALRPSSAQTVVVFHGMPGVGKTSCALELAYRHESSPFHGQVWHNCSLSTQFEAFVQGLRAQLPSQVADQSLAAPENLLSSRPLLLTIDGAESMLTSEGDWIDCRWEQFFSRLATMSSLPSRIVLTTTRVPDRLRESAAVLCLAVHPLSRQESILLSRQLPNLRALFGSEDGLSIVGRALETTSGHPVLLECADQQAGDLDRLRRQLESGWPEASGEEVAGGEGPRVFAELEKWAWDVAAALPEATKTLFSVLGRLEEVDRDAPILDAILRFAAQERYPEVANAMAGDLDHLAALGLIEVSRRSPSLRLHPAVAAAGREATSSSADGIDDLFLRFWSAVVAGGSLSEMSGSVHRVGVPFVESCLRTIPYLLRRSRWETAVLVVEQVLARELTPRSLRTALSAVEKIARSGIGGTTRTVAVGQAARVLVELGRPVQAQERIAGPLDEAIRSGDWVGAAYLGILLANMHLGAGRYEEALCIVSENEARIRGKGLSRTTLGLMGQRLKVLNAMGESSRVLDECLQVRERLLALDDRDSSGVEELFWAWALKEAMLDTGRSAAHRLERWPTALTFNADVLRIQRDRGAHPTVVARSELNGIGPRLALGRIEEAQAIARRCRPILEEFEDTGGLALLYSALAMIEYTRRRFTSAVEFEEIALSHHYATRDLERCAGAHLNLGSFLREIEGQERRSLAHWMASAYITLSAAPMTLGRVIRNLARHWPPEALPSLDEVTSVVQCVRGVALGELIRSLPHRELGAASARVEIQARVRREQRRGEVRDPERGELPAAVRCAIDGEDIEGLETALLSLGLEDALALWKRLEKNRTVSDLSNGAVEGVRSVGRFEVFLQRLQTLRRAVVAAVSNPAAQPALRHVVLPDFEKVNRIRITSSVVRMWQGDLDERGLVLGLDDRSASVVRIILDAFRTDKPDVGADRSE